VLPQSMTFTCLLRATPATFDFPAQAVYNVTPEMPEPALTSDVRDAETVNNASEWIDYAPLPRFAYTEIFERYAASSWSG
jgi:hypothetical protein